VMMPKLIVDFYWMRRLDASPTLGKAICHVTNVFRIEASC